MRSFLLVLCCCTHWVMGGAAPETDGSACHDGPSFDSCSPPANGDKGTVMLQQASKTGSKLMLSYGSEALPPLTRHTERLEVVVNIPNSSGPLPLCHPAIVAWTCYNLNGGHEGVDNVTKDRIQDLASLNDTTVNHLWDALKLTEVGTSVPCARLCTSVIEYVEAHGILPPSSDRACYTLDGQTSCGVDVAPPKLVEEMADGVNYRPDKGFRVADPTLHSGLIQHSIEMTDNGGVQVVKRSVAFGSAAGLEEHKAEAEPQMVPASCPYSLWGVVELIANFFRIYPSQGRSRVIDGPKPSLAQGESATTVAQVIANDNVQAKAWVAQVVVELANWRTAPSRQKWFGGGGLQTESQVRDRIVLAMNFINRELETVRYVYPADDAVRTACTGNTAAYVWKSSASNDNGYRETTGPLCRNGVNPKSQICGVDDSGRFFVYLCQVWLNSPDNWRISTLIHEAAHHTGPSDETYDVSVMKQISQARQLNNAANYEHFAQEVASAAWGCLDSNPPNVPFSCNPGPCTCVSMASYCQDPTYGATIRSECPMTCGLCNGQTSPSPTPSPPAPPAPSPPAPPPSGGCSEPSTEVTVVLGGTPYTAYCSVFAASNACQYRKVRSACPASCRTCTAASPTPSPPAPPTPSPPAPPPSGGCSEPSTEVTVTLGGSSYRGSCAAFAASNTCQYRKVQSACPVSCGACAVGPTCSDDPSYTIQTQYGLWTCDNWKPYQCWEEVVPHCPVSCRVTGCV